MVFRIAQLVSLESGIPAAYWIEEPWLPSGLLRTVALFHKIHCLWRWHRDAKDIYLQGDNFKKLVAGHAFHWLVGDRLLLRIAAQATLIARRLLDLRSQRNELAEAYHDWLRVLRGNIGFSGCSRALHHLPPRFVWISPSSYADYRDTAVYLIELVRRVILCTARLLQEMFILSMRLMDVREALSLEPSVGRSAVNEIFVHSSHVLNELLEHKDELLQELLDTQDTVDPLLVSLGSPYRVEHLVQVLDTTLERTKSLQKVLGKASAYVENDVRELAYTFMYTTVGWAPLWLRNQKK